MKDSRLIYGYLILALQPVPKFFATLVKVIKQRLHLLVSLRPGWFTIAVNRSRLDPIREEFAENNGRCYRISARDDSNRSRLYLIGSLTNPFVPGVPL